MDDEMYVITHICKPLLQYVSYKKSYCSISSNTKMLLAKAKFTAFASESKSWVFRQPLPTPTETDSCYSMCHPDPPPLNIHGNTFIYKEGSKASS